MPKQPEIRIITTDQGFIAEIEKSAFGNNPRTQMWPTEEEARAAASRGEVS